MRNHKVTISRSTHSRYLQMARADLSKASANFGFDHRAARKCLENAINVLTRLHSDLAKGG